MNFELNTNYQFIETGASVVARGSKAKDTKTVFVSVYDLDFSESMPDLYVGRKKINKK